MNREDRGQGTEDRTVKSVLWFAIIAIIGAVVGLILTSCATLEPGADPVVVNAERTIQIGIDTFDSFLKFERNNEASLPPAAHSFAKYLQARVGEINPLTGEKHARAQQWLSTAAKVTEAYKHNRSPENKASVETAIAVITSAIQQSNLYLGKPTS